MSAISMILVVIVAFLCINRAGKFVGFDNYVKLFQSADFWTDVKNTLVYAVAYAPIA